MSGIQVSINERPQTEMSFEEKVQQFIQTRKPKLIIMVPCFGSICYTGFVAALLGTFNLFNKIGFPIQIEFCRNDSLVSRARNNLIAKAMSDPTSTHFLFIDNDITWAPVDILKLILADKPLSGGVYPIKHLYWDRLQEENVIAKWLQRKNNSELKNLVSDTQFIQHKMVRYNINNIGNILSVENNLTVVKHLATGFMMIQRNVIEKMTMAFPSTKYTDDVGFLQGDENKYAYALFDCGVEEGHYFSEDWLFCSRWTKMGGQIWVDVTINLTHTGLHDFEGSFISSVV